VGMGMKFITVSFSSTDYRANELAIQFISFQFISVVHFVRFVCALV